MLPYPQFEELFKRLQRCRPFGEAWKGTFYRATTIDYANRHDLLTGVGSRRTGGRWNPPRRFNTVYGSLEPETAMAEALANFREFGIPVSQAMPLVFVAVTVEIQAVLDLTRPEVQRALRVSTRQMTARAWVAVEESPVESITQALGRAAWKSKWEALIVPSARQRGARNIVLFPGRRRSGSSWRTQRARQLPKKHES